MPDGSEDSATQMFTDHRELVFSIVYNMLGSVSDTEDVLQETWLAWVARDLDTIDNQRAYLIRIAVNKALARQSALRRLRETYFGQWLPEPLVSSAGVDSAEDAVGNESLSMALLVVLETLTPLERAVFILFEVFGYSQAEIAGMIDRTPAAVRQIAHRAREHVQARRPRYPVDPRTQRQATERFMAAAFGGDLNSLLDLLAPEVTLWTDGGGKATAAGPLPIHGRDKVARLLMARAPRRSAGLDIQYRLVNGEPSGVLFVADSPFAVFVLDLTSDGDRVRDIYAVTNPDKLSRIN
ncbi:sigma-70 family RNA polymerase sigma factor [Nonomuraea mesophila]|uniref:Sigma-70 family RNA polymerase sigma factor n=1 Tax=Nonomuraea mesophila TaxID=2530382 RepID=A0A4R5FWV2_9ACTN|nr:RNA polymerase sigma factor SigJ [Nonomuraea mesophila]TDE59653.1 sigma-70 family RNA polymerase sigma factor [Nonomuraea mesophila]